MRKPRKKLLITGISGLLGSNLASYFKDKYTILGLYNTHPVNIKGIRTQKVDILSRFLLDAVIDEFNPELIVHCAALAEIDFCEANKELADRVNVLGTKIIVDCVKERETKFIYISTDSVYDGSKGNYSETDPLTPLNYYGLTKYKGEKEALKKGNCLVFRTNFFGWNIQDKRSLGEWVVHELSNNRHIRGFKDVYFSSIYTLEFAKILDKAIDKNLTGIYNCASRNSLSKYEFAARIAEVFGFNKSLIKPISIDEFNFTAKRGKDLTLTIDKLSSALDYVFPTINESIEAFYNDYKAGLPEKIAQKSEIKT